MEIIGARPGPEMVAAACAARSARSAAAASSSECDLVPNWHGAVAGYATIYRYPGILEEAGSERWL